MTEKMEYEVSAEDEAKMLIVLFSVCFVLGTMTGIAIMILTRRLGLW